MLYQRLEDLFEKRLNFMWYIDHQVVELNVLGFIPVIAAIVLLGLVAISQFGMVSTKL